VNSYKIIMLGPTGAGKTVYLSSMFHQLSIQSDRIGFYLSTPPAQRKGLVAKYNELESLSWPEGNKPNEIFEWQFTCQVQSESIGQYPALHFSYLDYAGGDLTTTVSGIELNKFDEHVNSADVLMGLLDGYKIYCLLANVPFEGPSIYQDLGNILPIMQERDIPCHFVISKWDILQESFSLEQVRAKLEEDHRFASFVSLRRNIRVPIRIIPVSAVGQGYAIPNADGKMLINPGVRPQPFQVEMPLACVLPDRLETHLSKILKERIELEKTGVRSHPPEYAPLDLLGKFFGNTLRRLNEHLPLPYRFSEPIMLSLVDFLERGAINREEEAIQRDQRLRQEREQSLLKVKDEETAITHVLTCMMQLIGQLERSFPASNLKKSI
jgi:hypothetical protein